MPGSLAPMAGLRGLLNRNRIRERTPGRRPGPVAFVLSGGGNLGALQVGMLRALLEHDITPDLILGCSVGAINGAALAETPTVAGARHTTRAGTTTTPPAAPCTWSRARWRSMRC